MIMCIKPDTKWCEYCKKIHPYTTEYYHADIYQKWGLHIYCKKQLNFYINILTAQIVSKKEKEKEKQE